MPTVFTKLLRSPLRIENTGWSVTCKSGAGLSCSWSNSIAWLAHRLSSLYDAQDEKVFDSVIVVTDRVVLDQIGRASCRERV